jgi:transposase
MATPHSPEVPERWRSEPEPPVMMTKLFVYGYRTKVYFSRIPAKAVRENVMFMGLSGGQKLDFRRLNDFRGKMQREVMSE